MHKGIPELVRSYCAGQVRPASTAVWYVTIETAAVTSPFCSRAMSDGQLVAIDVGSVEADADQVDETLLVVLVGVVAHVDHRALERAVARQGEGTELHADALAFKTKP